MSFIRNFYIKITTKYYYLFRKIFNMNSTI